MNKMDDQLIKIYSIDLDEIMLKSMIPQWTDIFWYWFSIIEHIKMQNNTYIIIFIYIIFRNCERLIFNT